MCLGIFARTFDEPTLDQVLVSVARHNIKLVHFNLRCAGLEALPSTINDALCAHIRLSFERRRLEMVAISGTFNMIHPKSSLRRRMLQRARLLIERAPDLGTRFVTLCTGTRDSHNMWQTHSENDSPEAWRDLINSLENLLPLAEAHGVELGIEPEKGNVICSAVKARRLLDQMESKHLKIVMDGANLLGPDDTRSVRDILVEAFDLLGPDIAMVHAKDIADGKVTNQEIGKGRLDWNTYFQCIRAIGFDVPIILHNLAPSQVDASVQFVRGYIR